jgi:hypothetical protein
MIGDPRSKDYQDYLEAVRGSVCDRCIDRQPDGPPCFLDGELCPVELHFPRILQAVLEGVSPTMDDYVKRLRAEVCPHCEHFHPDGTCDRGDMALCTLHIYFPLIVDAIEETRAAKDKEQREALWPPGV